MRLFELAPNAAKTGWIESVVYDFCSQTSCTDGANPLTGVILGAEGVLYGETFNGGTVGAGTVFMLQH